MNLTKLSSYDYSLPKELIAQTAHQPADECKMLYFYGEIKDLIFKDIKDLLSENDVLFFNNSKVVKARINALQVNNEQGIMNNENEIRFYLIDDKGNKKGCSNCEILFLRKIETNNFEALVRPGKKFKNGRKILIEKGYKKYEFKVIAFSKEGRIISYEGMTEDKIRRLSEGEKRMTNKLENDIFEVLEQIGKMPLPPYISYSKEKEKPYQPVQAKKEGSVAAPTASLHFTKELFADLEKKGIEKLESTLHIGMGTFKTVDVEDITNYDIHSELVEIPLDIFKKIGEKKEQEKNIVAVGTTATRILESLPYLYKRLQKINSEDYQKIQNDYFDKLVKDISLEQANKFIDGEIFIGNDSINFYTKLYIYPGFNYKIIDKLITNFHLPKSSLLMLVAAFMGYENMMKAYKHAIKNKYKFFSFGDAMFIDKITK